MCNACNVHVVAYIVLYCKFEITVKNIEVSELQYELHDDVLVLDNEAIHSKLTAAAGLIWMPRGQQL